MPFAGYEDFDECVQDNQDKDDPQAFCAWLEEQTRECDMNKLERRYVTNATLEVESREEGNAPVLRGVIPYNSLSVDLGGFREVFRPGAFSETIERDDIVGLFNHETSLILGRKSAGTLRFQDSESGLSYSLDLPDTQAGRDVMVSVRRGDIIGTSFAFLIDNCERDERWERGNEYATRNVLKARLMDVSPCTYPAYPDSTVALRSLEQWRQAQKPTARLLRQRRQRLTELA